MRDFNGKQGRIAWSDLPLGVVAMHSWPRDESPHLLSSLAVSRHAPSGLQATPFKKLLLAQDPAASARLQENLPGIVYTLLH